MTQKNTLAESFIKDLDAYFYGPNFWQAGLYQQVKDLTIEQALWKPSPERHCIWEILLHLNSWKWFAVENLKGNTIESMREYNWLKLPEDPDEKRWKEDVAKLKNFHEELKGLVIQTEASFFDPSNKISNHSREVVYHDCYHCGQIGFIRALQGIKPVE